MTTVLAFGTFDLLHPGHLSYLKQALEHGDKLVVIVATDSNVEKIKKKPPINDQEHRKELVKALEIVDDAFIGEEDDMIKSVEKVNPDVVCLGYDQQPVDIELQKAFDKKGIKAKIFRAKPFNEEQFKSSKIKKKVFENHNK
ncbi:MAG: adenylyltransferase/cytidyltransferase family protein [Candidatus Diapherotrites archaeon]